MRGTAEVEWEIGVPPLVNDDSIIEAVAEAAAKTIGADHVSYVKNPSMGSEDFSVLFPKFGPGAQFRLGSGNNEIRIPDTDFITLKTYSMRSVSAQAHPSSFSTREIS